MRLVWSERARERMREEVAFLERTRPFGAYEWLVQVGMAVQRLPDFPFSGKRLREFPRLSFREMVLGDYRIIYLPEPEQVTIVTVKHARQRVRRADVALKTLK